MTLGEVFAGIGGFSLAFELAGFRTLWQVEISDYRRRVLEARFPEAKRYTDIREVDGTQLESVTVVAGGFPCQPWSVAGKQGGTADDRNLWPEMRRVVGEVRPAFVVAENVPGLVTWRSGVYFDKVLSDLEDLGYETAPTLVIPAAGVGAAHLRNRIWIVARRMADTDASERRQVDPGRIRNQGIHDADGVPRREKVPGRFSVGGPIRHVSYADGERREELDISAVAGKQAFPDRRDDARRSRRDADGSSSHAYAADRGSWRAVGESGWWSVEPDVGRMAHGVPARVDRLSALGDAVVPAVAYRIALAIRAVMESENVG